MDHGMTWLPVVSECLQGSADCEGYHTMTAYDDTAYWAWRRVTVPLPNELRYEIFALALFDTFCNFLISSVHNG